MTKRPRPTRQLLGVVGALLAACLAASSANAAAGWSKPVLVRPDDCEEPAIAIDSGGHPHVAMDCAGWIGYAVERGGTWTSVLFKAPPDRLDGDARIAIDGNTVYLAFTSATPSCCFNTYYRSRTLPDGAWSAAKRLGRAGDRLHSFRAVGGVLHATAAAATDKEIYETYGAGVLKRYVIPGAMPSSPSSLRIGSDGRARVAYEAANHTLRYGRFTGTGFAWSTLPHTGRLDVSPALVLDPQNHAHIAWEHRTDFEDPTVTPEEHAADGTYYATNRSGAWVSRRITKSIGDVSLTVDRASGRIHVLVGGEQGLKYYTRSAAGVWLGATIDASAPDHVGIGLRQSTGRLFAVFSRRLDDQTFRVLISTKP
jgi:hypothetical protein